MRNILCVSLFLILTSASFGQATPSEVLAGSIVNYWTQGGLRVTDKPFDLGVQGNGFFAIQLPDGSEAFTRYGEMSLNADGYLTHNPTRGLVLGYCAGELTPIQLSQYARDADGTVLKSFRTELNGSIKAFYANGYAHETCKVALALFQNPSVLRRTGHLLQATADSGLPFIGIAQNEGRGSIYGASLEDLDEQMYGLNIKSASSDRVIVEMEKERRANEQWSKQKTLFYIYDLKVTRDELSVLEASTEKCGQEIQKIVAIAEKGSNKISDEDFSAKIKLALNRNEAEVLSLLGPERLEMAKKFREDFNKDVWEKFGTDLKFTGF